VVFKVGNKFYVEEDGSLYATNANITGIITANGGTIGDFEISEGGLQYPKDWDGNPDTMDQDEYIRIDKSKGITTSALRIGGLTFTSGTLTFTTTEAMSTKIHASGYCYGKYRRDD
jgi:hypothetical protein